MVEQTMSDTDQETTQFQYPEYWDTEDTQLLRWLDTQAEQARARYKSEETDGSRDQPFNRGHFRAYKKVKDRILDRYRTDADDEAHTLTELLETIQTTDDDSLNGGCYIEPHHREKAEELVTAGKVVRLQRATGRSPLYVPMDSDQYSQERLETLQDRQMDKDDDQR